MPIYGKARSAPATVPNNYSQDRVTDHRIKKSWHNLPKIMEGGLDEIIKDLDSGAVGLSANSGAEEEEEE